jgi:predicted branched-subunit amino acid permease
VLHLLLEFRFNSQGIEFALTALFIVLTLEQAKRLRQALPFVIALGTGLVALLVLPDQHLLLGAIGSASVLLLAHYRYARRSVNGQENSHAN